VAVALDPAEKRRLFERLSSVREIVFGVQDGVLTTAGVLAGLSGAVNGRTQIIMAALASTAAGALSMGAGAYLGTRAEVEVIRGELARARREAAGQPYIVQEELLEKLAGEGLTREAAYRVVKLLSGSPEALLTTVEAKIYGLGSAGGNALLDGITMGAAFLAGALVPLLSFIFIATVHAGLIAAMATTALTLFTVGYFQGWLANHKRCWISGLRFLTIAMSAAAAGYLIGLAIAPLGSVPSL
jgi:VIT1/CCC1 family predicted Fe2+/Mn2+ transporter